MKKKYCFGQASSRWIRLAFAALLTVGAATAIQAQSLNYNLYGVQVGTLPASSPYIDLASFPSTVIATPNTDDANSAPQNIGFTFNYNGQSFTQFVLNTNGFIKLGNSAPTGSSYFEGAQTGFGGPFDSSDANLLVPFNEDLQSGTSPAEYRVITDGTAPNRVCVIQWKNVQDKARPVASGKPNVGPIYTNMQFQIWLSESSNIIDFIYGPTTGGTSTAIKLAAVGIKGTNSTNGNLLTATKESTTPWVNASFQDNFYLANSDAFNVSSAIVPPTGLIYRFNPAKSNDLYLSTIYTLGKLSTSVSLPHSVAAAVTNIGTTTRTNVPVTLAVAGANTFTNSKSITSIAPGATATVTFDPYPATLTQGTNNLTVSVPTDDDASNNTDVYTQQVTPSTIAYIDDTQPSPYPLGLGDRPNVAFATKFLSSRPVAVNQVKLTFPTSTTTADYQVIIYNSGSGGTPGAPVYTSATRTRAAAAAVETITIPPTVVTGNFFVGVKEITNSVNLGFQIEDPIRNGTFYYTQDGTNWLSLADIDFPARLAMEVSFTTVTANSPELQRAISVYPNPSTGTVTLSIHGVAAKGALQVQVSNLLGQTVYTGTAKNEATNTLNLANLASGVYNLKVQNGDQYTIQKLVIE
ncbi:T9SS type A sorting domain-containing protein [Hymenobacter sp. GOD-10R]|uniref:T9SS type A sorting domain-containing protein n=1 Tax=Hymenobacter sp. GOD-10R TaxID=3093922 RepID=UPI002D767C58|nr:T9SS type A sorting domain-containing protein [Hymenobacter sp. GOD-10R]WRQ28066.1 T9SS type A sorting domain-containing protein [Hymenobacter sp. GOD-10R]